MAYFITPQDAFTNYEDGGEVDIPDDEDYAVASNGRRTPSQTIRLNSAGRKVTKDEFNNEGALYYFRTCFVRTKRLCGRDHRNRFIYPNGWSTNTGRRAVCKEDDWSWSLTRENQYNVSNVSRDPCMNVFISLLLMAVLSVLAGNLLPR